VDQLPTPIVEVEVPESFAPSQWEQLEMCPLSVWAQNRGALPESVEITVGRILHDVRAHFVASTEGQDAPRLASLLSDTVAEYEQRLRSDPATACLTPIRQVFGRRKWSDAEARLRRWSTAPPIQRGPRQGGHSLGESLTTVRPTISFGVERPWNVPALRLRGRPDEACVAPDGSIEIVDYKSGSIVDRQGVRSSVATQLHLYALMAEYVTGRSVRLFVHGRQRISIEWDESRRAQTSERVQSASIKYSPGTVLPANQVANPGSHCVGCRLRAQCPRYLHEAPTWWPNTGAHPRPLPLDVWGTLRARGRDSVSSILHLDDPAGRRVVISGIDRRHGVDTIVADEEVYAFGLAGGEDQFMHGRPLHPRAFHERSPSPRWESAPCPRFYVGPGRTHAATPRDL
jgi:CRISPR/Cas system-associated exonuclease Cas4 (RecB family)